MAKLKLVLVMALMAFLPQSHVAQAATLVVYPPVSQSVSIETLRGLSPLPDPSTLPDGERTLTLDPFANSPSRSALPIGVEAVDGFVRWVNASVGGVECGQVRNVDEWEPSPIWKLGVVCERVGEGASGEIVGVEIWVEGSEGLERVWGQNVVKYDDLRNPIVSNVVGKVASGVGGGPTLAVGDSFGRSVCWVGGDREGAVLVGAPEDNTGFSSAGAIYLMRMDEDGAAHDVTKIASGVNGGPTLSTSDWFGTAVGWLGDVDGDGEAWEVVVGAEGTSSNTGSIYVMSVRFDQPSIVLSHITSSTNGGPSLNTDDRFGASVACIGDVDGDGRAFDIAIGAYYDDTKGTDRGAVYIMSILPDGIGVVLTTIRHGDGISGPVLKNYDYFGSSVGHLWGWTGWKEEDGAMLMIGANGDDSGSSSAGAVYLIHVDSTMEVSVEGKVASSLGGGPQLDQDDDLGMSVCGIGDVDGDGGTVELLVGATGDDSNLGAVYVLSVDSSSWEVVWWRKIASGVGGGMDLGSGSDQFGISAAFVGDLTNLGRPQTIIIGAFKDNTGGGARGAIHVLSLSDLTSSTSLPSVTISFPNTTSPPSMLSQSLPSLSPHASDPSRSILHLSLLTSTYNAAANVRILNATIGSFPCATTSLMPSWPISNNTRRIGVICEGVPEGPAGKAVGVEVWVDDLRNPSPIPTPYSISSNFVAAYDDLSRPIVSKVVGKVASGVGGGPTLAVGDSFGRSVCWVGGDREGAVLVGAMYDKSGFSSAGAIYLMRMDEDEAAHDVTKIASGVNGGPTLGSNHYFGIAVTWLGDVDGDGEAWEVVVGAEEGGALPGSIYVMSVRFDQPSIVLSHITSSTNGGPSLDADDRFGASVACIGDVDGDGRAFDIAVGAYFDDTGGTNRGAVYIMSILSDGTGIVLTTITHSAQGPAIGDGDIFGYSVGQLWGWTGWEEEDGKMLAVGTHAGIFHVVHVESNGEFSGKGKVTSNVGGGPPLDANDYFGISVCGIGDMDGDGGTTELITGAFGDDTGGVDYGAVYVLSMDVSSWEVIWWRKVGSRVGGGPILSDTTVPIGISVALIADFSNLGRPNSIVVGAHGDNTGGTNCGAIHILSIADLTSTTSLPSISTPFPLPRLEPLAVNPTNLSISILTDTFDASNNVVISSVHINSNPCTSFSILPSWPVSNNSRRLGVLCEGVPGGVGGSTAVATVEYTSKSSFLPRLVVGPAAVYTPCYSLPSNLSSLSLSQPPSLLHPLGGTLLTLHAQSFSPFNLSDPASVVYSTCNQSWSQIGVSNVSPTPSTIDASKVVFEVWVGGRACVERRWVDEQTVQCVAPAGLGKGLDIVVGVLGAFGVLVGEVEYGVFGEEQLVQAVSPEVGLAQDGSSTLTLLTTFQSLTPIPFKPVSISLGPFTTPVLTVNPLFNTPKGAGYSLPVSFCVVDTHSPVSINLPRTAFLVSSNETCTAQSTFAANVSYTPPELAFVNPNADLDLLGGTTLTLNGVNFGDPETLLAVGVAPSVWIEERQCTSISHISSTRIRCVTPSLSGTSAKVKVTLLGSASLEDVSVSILAVSLVAVSPRLVMPAAEGVRELDFSATIFGASQVARLFIGGVECTSFQVTAEDRISCPSLPIPSRWTTDDAWLFIDGKSEQVSPRAVLRAEPPPTILSVNTPFSSPTTGGVFVEVVGLGFGLEESDFAAVIVGGDGDGGGNVATSDGHGVELKRFDGEANHTSSTSISIFLPPGCGKNVPVRVVTTWQLVSEPFFFNYDPPILSTVRFPTQTVKPALLPGLSNVTLDICGTNLAPRSVDIDVVSVGGIRCPTTSSTSPSCIQCSNLPTPGSQNSNVSDWVNQGIEVVVNGQSSGQTLGLATFIPAPLLTDATPSIASPGDTIKLLGMGMGSGAGYVTGVWVGGGVEGGIATQNESVFVSVTYSSPTQVSFTLPPGVGSQIPVRFLTTTSLFSNPKFISYNPPTITSISPPSLLPGQSSLTITLCGSNFPSRSQDVKILWVGGKECEDVRVLAGEGCVECSGWEGIGVGETWVEEERMLVAGFEGQMTSSSLATYVPLPGVETITPSAANPGDKITINGVGFGVKPDDVREVRVGGVECDGVEWVSETRLRCIIPNPHPIWEEALADRSVLVPRISVVVELESGMESTSLVEGGNSFEPSGGVRVRPDPAEAPWNVVGWRTVGQSGSLTVRWRFPGPALEAARIEERRDLVDEGSITDFTVQVTETIFDADKDQEFKSLLFTRDVSRDSIADPTDADETSEEAWETHEVTVSLSTASPVLIRVRAQNSDGHTNWTMAYDPDPRQGMLISEGRRIPESCQQDSFLKTQRDLIQDMVCAPCPQGAVCGGLGEKNVTGVGGYWRVPWSKDGLGFSPCDLESACLGYLGQLSVTSSPSSSETNPSLVPSNASNATIESTVVVKWGVQDAADRDVALSSISLIPSNHEGCTEGHRGTLCSACAVNYFPGVGGVCTACGHRAWIAGRFVLLCLAILIALSFIIVRAYQTRFSTSSKEVQIMKIIFSHLQTVAIVGGVQLRWPEIARGFFNTVDAGSSFATSGLAIECLMGESSSNPFLRTILILIMPFLLVLYILLFWGVIGVLEARIDGCQRCVRGINMQQGDDAAAPSSSSPKQSSEMLTTSPSTILPSSKRKRRPTVMSSNSSTWQERVILSLVVLAFLVHTPLTSAAFRLMTCRPIHAIDDPSQYQLRLVMDLDVRCATPYNMALIAGISIPMVVFIALGIPIGVGLLLRSIGPEKLQSNLWKQRLGFLTNGYRMKHYYWECVVLLRKVFLAFSTTTLAPTGGGMQVTMALLVVLLAMALHARAQPYTSKPINVLEGIALVTGAVTLVCGQFVTLDSGGLAGTASGFIGIAASIFLIAINSLFFAIALALFSVRARAAMTTCLRRFQEQLGLDEESLSRTPSFLSSMRQTLSSAPTTSPIAIENPMRLKQARNQRE